MMKLYYAPGACSLAVHIALCEAALPFELVRVDPQTGTASNGCHFLEVNPRGYVPVLELADGSRHTEAAALLQYVAELAPSAGLLPSIGTAERLQVLQWLVFAATEVHGPFGWLWKRDTADTTVRACRDKIVRRFSELDDVLAERPFVVGQAFSIVDAYCFTALSWAAFLEISLVRFSNLGAYLRRIASRPAVRAALAAENLLPAESSTPGDHP
jgi:glutathione S-transferase